MRMYSSDRLWFNETTPFILPDPDSDSYSETDSCTMQDFSIGLDSNSDPLLEIM